MGIGLGIFLIAVGAILAFAVQNEPSGLDLDATGWILMLAGLVLVLLSLAFWSYRRRTRVVAREVYPTYAQPPVYPVAPVYPPATDRVVEREVYPPAVDRVVEREVPRPIDRVVEREVYRDGPP